jgi:hypothetical protein
MDDRKLLKIIQAAYGVNAFSMQALEFGADGACLLAHPALPQLHPPQRCALLRADRLGGAAPGCSG